MDKSHIPGSPNGISRGIINSGIHPESMMIDTSHVRHTEGQDGGRNLERTHFRGSSPSPEKSGEKRSEAHIETPKPKQISTGIHQWEDGPKEYFH